MAETTQVIEGRIEPGAPDWVYVPIEVPEGIGELAVTYSYDQPEPPPGLHGNALDAGIFDSAGFRGWSGGARDSFFINGTEATPGYVPGPIGAGTWRVLLGPYTVHPDGMAYRVEVTLRTGSAGGARLLPSPAPVRRLRFSRDGTNAVRLGERAEVSLYVTNPSRRGLRGVVRDAWPPSAGAESQRHGLSIPSGERRRVITRLRPTRRGDRHAYRVTVRSLGPLRFAGRQGSHQVPWTVRALPPFESRKHLPSRLARLRELDGRASVLVRGQGTEFDSLRDYVHGDDVRSIDWRATARRQAVVVRTWRPERDRHVLIVLDTGRTSAGRVGDGTRLDHALDAALLLAALATRAGDRVDLLAYDRTVQADVERAGPRDVLPRFTTAMALLEPRLVETDHRGLVTAISLRATQRSLVVLLTGLDAAVIDEGLSPVLGPLLRRHEVVVASVADPRIVELAAGRGSAEAVYAAAAAEQARAERRRTTELLERRGVTVVDAAPDRIAPDLADTYLALKKAGRL